MVANQTQTLRRKRRHPKEIQMKTKILAAIAVTAMLALGANGQSAGGTAGSGTAAGVGTITGTSSGVNGVNTVPNNPNVIVTPNPNQGTLAPPVNPNTPVVGGGMAPNNLGMGSNNLALGSNTIALGSNQFALRTNGIQPTPLTPTGPNGSGFNNPTANTNRILLRP